MSYSYKDSMLKVIKSTACPEDFTLSHPAKISLEDNCSFSLPAGLKFSCPGATEACKDCYATKNRHVFRPVQSVFARNWLLLRRCERYNKMDKATSLILSQIRDDAEIFRIHESGDFHSQWAVEMWENIIKNRKDVDFWAYTRSFMMDYSRILKQKNFALWASTDNFNLIEAEKFVKKYKRSGVKHAYGPWDRTNQVIPANSFICPVTNHKMVLDGACEKCKLCVVKKKTSKNVVFLAH